MSTTRMSRPSIIDGMAPLGALLGLLAVRKSGKSGRLKCTEDFCFFVPLPSPFCFRGQQPSGSQAHGAPPTPTSQVPQSRMQQQP
jgi:hypothetical protein